MDITYALDAYAAAEYLIKYMTKEAEGTSSLMENTKADGLKKIRPQSKFEEL